MSEEVPEGMPPGTTNDQVANVEEMIRLETHLSMETGRINRLQQRIEDLSLGLVPRDGFDDADMAALLESFANATSALMATRRGLLTCYSRLFGSGAALQDGADVYVTDHLGKSYSGRYDAASGDVEITDQGFPVEAYASGITGTPDATRVSTTTQITLIAPATAPDTETAAPVPPAAQPTEPVPSPATEATTEPGGGSDLPAAPAPTDPEPEPDPSGASAPSSAPAPSVDGTDAASPTESISQTDAGASPEPAADGAVAA